MIIKYLVALYILIEITCDAQSSEGILILRDNNIDQTIRKNKYILVNFYAPRHDKSKEFEKEYLKLNQILREYESEIVLAKIDATKGLSSRFRVDDLPQVALHIEGTPVKYTGAMFAYQILQWLHKKTKPTTRVIRNVQELKDFEEDYEMGVIGLFSSLNSKEAKLLKEIAKTVDDATFAITNELTVFKELGFEGTESIVILKKNEGRYNLSGKFYDSKIRKFINQYKLPLVYEYNPQTNVKLFESELKVNLMFFMSKSSRNYAKDMQEFKSAADKLRGKVTFVLIDIDQAGKISTAYDFLGEAKHETTFFQKILRFFGVKRQIQPRVHLVNIVEDKPVFYKLDLNETDSISSEMVSQFVDDFFHSRIKPRRKSEPIPADWDAKPVKVLVGKNFDQVARDRKKAVLVKFFSSSSHECKRLAPMYEKLALSFKDEPDMMVAKINGVANELDDIKIENYPAFKLFPRGSKKMVDFKGDPSFDNLSAFLRSNGKEMTPPKKKEIDEIFDVPVVNEEL